MTSFVHDLRYALRSLRRAPRFAAVVVLTLALGIGANTAIFSVVNRLLLHPLPYPDSDRLVYLALGSAFTPRGFPVTKRITLGWQQQARSLEGVEAYINHDFLATTGDRTDVVLGLSVTPGLMTLLRVHPVIGRGFVPEDARPGAAPVVLISTALWRRAYAGSRDVLGHTITLDGMPRTVVGVIPQEAGAIAGPSDQRDIWLPLTLESADTAFSPTDFVNVVGRLRPGVTIAQARHELDAITARMPKQTVFSGIEQTAVVTQPSQEFLSARTHDVLLVLLAAVAVVLLVACANVANILLARGTARTREIALRTALGANRWRLVRALLVESIVLAVAGGMLGLLFAWWGTDLLARFGPDELAIAGGVPLDARVLEFTLAISLVTGVLFGLMPALRTASAQLGHTLRSGGSGVVRSGRRSRARAVLVAGEMALSVLLLVSAGLLIRSVGYLQQIDPGFDVQHVFTMRVALSRSGYQTVSSREQFGERMLSGLRRLPGVAVATEALGAPPGYTKGVEPHLHATGAAHEPHGQTIVAFNNVMPDYFKALGIRLISGRTFTQQEMTSGHAVIVNQTLAHSLWPRQPAVGQQLDLDVIGPSTVVGVAADVVTGGLTGDKHDLQLYVPYRAATVPTLIGEPPQLTFIVRTVGDPASVMAAIRPLTRSIDPDVAVRDITRMETRLGRSIAGPRFNMMLLSAFAVLALALAAVGLAGVIGYSVTERTHEIGIRMALGAQETSVLRLVIAQGMRAALIGVGLGIVGALAATRLMSSLLYGIAPRDPVTFIGVTALLLVVGLAASWLPARRATRVDPIIALRAE